MARKLNSLQGQEKINQIEHIDVAGAKAILGGVLVPGAVKTDNVSTAGVFVGKYNILRVQVAADTYVAFSDDSTIGAVSVATTPGIKLPQGYHLIVATGEFVRASANFTRLEIISVDG